MSIRVIASVVIAALLMTGGAVTAAQVTEYGVQPTNEAQQQAIEAVKEQPSVLTAEEAKAIALTHAGLEKGDVTGLKAERDSDDGVTYWDIEFRSGDWEYDYVIHAETGEVIWNEKEHDPEETVAETVPAETQPKAKKLTVEEAKTIALAHAGLTADQVEALQAEYDVDDGIPVWEVEFSSGDMEYSYEIHGETGKILFCEKERED